MVRLKDYPQAFPLARSLHRTIHFRLGPTNSGKTHDALEALKRAASGVYLAPLRLLAMEIRDRLVAQGIPCNLLTGEEHDVMDGARHTACTVEMMNPEREVDVAVVDEIQMLQDPSRGWAWTSALVGAPARDVYVCGADTVHRRCVEVLDAIGERHETLVLKRKTPLVIEDAPVGSRRGRKHAEAGLQPGDAVIAFSRKDVLTLSARYRSQGLSVATIYGALAPEVRRTESERFASGEADVVVATDAIGMGLNLPVRRVIFSTVHKFDGVETRPLNAAEVQQIAGRAGRFGMHDEGRVTTLDREDLPHVRRMLAEPQPAMRSALTIAPSPWHVDSLAQLLGTRQIAPILSYFATRIAAKSSLFQ
ncbi:MAG: helicase, partial [Comamonadaceae bacterium]